MGLGLGSNLTKGGLTTPAIPTDNLVIKYNFDVNGNRPVSDGAAFFDGSNDYIAIADTATLSPSSITVSAWVKLNGAPDDDYPRIIDNGGASKGWHLRYSKSSAVFHVRVSDDGSAQELIASTSTYTDYGNWVHVAFTYN